LVWIDQKRDRRASTHQFVEHLKPFGRQCEEYLAQPRNIAPWVRKAGDEAEFDWISPEVEHYWNRTCRILGSERARCGACRDDHGHFAPHQFGRQFRQPLELIMRPAILDRDVLSFDVANLLQPLSESLHARGI